MPEISKQKTAGDLLKQSRESRNISLMTVHEATKIPMDVLKAIEEGYSVRSLSPFYLKGFIKMYAEYLGVNTEEILEKPIPVLKKSMQPSKPRITQLKEKTYASEDDFELGKLVSKERQRQIVQVVLIIAALIMATRLIGCLIPKKQPKSPVAPKETPVVSPKDIAEQKLVVKSAPAPIAPKQETKSALPAPSENDSAEKFEETGKVRLTVKALKGGWLQVKVDGNVVMESTVKSGTAETWEANSEIIISGRTIHNLEFELNGKMLGTLGRQDRNARRVVVTTKGLAVKG
ncbi:MAG: helix-turn-helix domain-containing protein [Candidatus Omnitrophota bacterium]